MTSIKVTYQGETKKVRRPEHYSALVKATQTAFPDLQESFKYIYSDEDGDTITVSNNEDLSEALEHMGDKLKLQVDTRPGVEESQQMSMFNDDIKASTNPFIGERPVSDMLGKVENQPSMI